MKSIPLPITIKDPNHLPFYASELAAGADVRAANEEQIVIQPGASACIPTGISLEIPPGYEVQVRPRSGLALAHQITLLNSPGTIDADFRGEVKIILINHGNRPFSVSYGMRIAQLVITEIMHAQFTIAETLATTRRGEGGFGHSGTH